MYRTVFILSRLYSGIFYPKPELVVKLFPLYFQALPEVRRALINDVVELCNLGYIVMGSIQSPHKLFSSANPFSTRRPRRCYPILMSIQGSHKPLNKLNAFLDVSETVEHFPLKRRTAHAVMFSAVSLCFFQPNSSLAIG